MEAGESSSNFRRKIGYLLTLSRTSPPCLLLTNSRRAFAFPAPPYTSPKLLTLVQEIFDTDLDGLAALARREGIRVKKARREGKEMLVFQNREPLLQAATSLERIFTPSDSE